MSDFILGISNLSKFYPGSPQVKALQGINLEVKKSSFIAITGPSGSGKSTLLNMIGTLDTPSEGRVIVDQVDVSTLAGNALSEFRRQKFGFIFQMFNLIPTLTALENVLLPMLPYRRKAGFVLEERAKELLVQVGLQDRAGHLPGQLSGGEQQRVAIARALLNNPPIILADEPTGNLDTAAGNKIVELLRNLNQHFDVTIILVTHNQKIADITDRIIPLKDGAIANPS